MPGVIVNDGAGDGLVVAVDPRAAFGLRLGTTTVVWSPRASRRRLIENVPTAWLTEQGTLQHGSSEGA